MQGQASVKQGAARGKQVGADLQGAHCTGVHDRLSA